VDGFWKLRFYLKDIPIRIILSPPMHVCDWYFIWYGTYWWFSSVFFTFCAICSFSTHETPLCPRSAVRSPRSGFRRSGVCICHATVLEIGCCHVSRRHVVVLMLFQRFCETFNFLLALPFKVTTSVLNNALNTVSQRILGLILCLLVSNIVS
jgi:hypothetical protein